MSSEEVSSILEIDVIFSFSFVILVTMLMFT